MHHNKVVSLLRESFLNLLIPLIYLVFVIMIAKTGHVSDFRQFVWWQWLLLGTFFLGLILWGISYLYIPPSLNLKPKANALVVSGPYRFLRHPIYLGAGLAFLSLSLVSQSRLAMAYTFLIILPINIGRALWEEKMLTEIFGEQYKRYQKQTLI